MCLDLHCFYTRVLGIKILLESTWAWAHWRLKCWIEQRNMDTFYSVARNLDSMLLCSFMNSRRGLESFVNMVKSKHSNFESVILLCNIAVSMDY